MLAAEKNKNGEEKGENLIAYKVRVFDTSTHPGNI